MCWFCGCYTKIVRQYQPVLDYLAILEREIATVAGVLPARFRVRHLHWGGGSPSLIRAAEWRRLLDGLRRSFALDDDAELAVEIDPRDASEASVATLATVGINRVSIGVQDFDASVQAAINRHQPFETVERVCDWLRRRGIARINLDLMYGLPYQTEGHVAAMVERAVTLRPSRVALFGYAHVPWMKTHQKLIPEAALAGPAGRLAQYRAGAEALRRAGYRPIGLDHFALPDDSLAAALADGRLRRNFQGYTPDPTAVLIGFGASAIGSLPQGYVQNAAPLRTYAAAVTEGRLPTARGIALTDDDRLRRDLIESLMCGLTVNLAEVCARHAADAAALTPAIDRLASMVEDGLLRIDGARLEMTEAGRPFVRVAAAAFDAYLGTDERRHSLSV
jgi:oxygen-independent coproporphyrinogen-3 oxidase